MNHEDLESHFWCDHSPRVAVSIEVWEMIGKKKGDHVEVLLPVNLTQSQWTHLQVIPLSRENTQPRFSP